MHDHTRFVVVYRVVRGKYVMYTHVLFIHARALNPKLNTKFPMVPIYLLIGAGSLSWTVATNNGIKQEYGDRR